MSSDPSDETLNRVTEFYQRDDISRQAPGRKDATSVRMDDGTKTKLQTRHLTSSIKVTDGMVQDEYPNTKVGKSKFAEMRSQRVVLSNKLPSVTRPLRTAGSAHVTYVGFTSK